MSNHRGWRTPFRPTILEQLPHSFFTKAKLALAVNALTPQPLRLNGTPGSGSEVPIFGYVLLNIVVIPTWLAATAWIVQYGPLDLEMARHFLEPAKNADALPQSIWLDAVGYHAARGIPTVVGVVAVVGGLISRVPGWRAILLTLGFSMIIGPVVVNAMKNLTSQHCPTQMREFGGFLSYVVDQGMPFWAPTKSAAGRCLPSGHAAGGYALLGLYFAGWACGRPAWRWSGLAIGVSMGLLFSLVRMMQGAHFASATLWSATIDWTVCAVFFLPLICRRSRVL